MAKGTSVKIFGIKATQARLLASSIMVKRTSETGLKKAGMHLQNEVKSSIAGRRAEPTSVDTGRFLNSVDMISTDVSATIFSPLDYSMHLEYGTSRITARKHFNNSKDRNQAKIISIIKDNIKV